MMTNQEVKAALSEFVKKQMVVLGPAVALSRARKVPGLRVNDGGEVVETGNNPELAAASLIEVYAVLIGSLARKLSGKLANLSLSSDSS